jgi:putative transposase
MDFQTGLIYHVYNQGNDRQPIFFRERNYPYFLKKMEKYLCPYADILCYCLMPNHFHWLLYVRHTELPTSKGKIRTLNDSIGILLRSYTRAIHIQEGKSGSLFREGTKAKNGIIDGVITLEGPNAHLFFMHGNEYALQCFQYIHKNPVKAGLATAPEDYPYSSAFQYGSKHPGTHSICNLKLGRKLLLGLE